MGVAGFKARDGKAHGPDQAKEYLTPERAEGEGESKVGERQKEVKRAEVKEAFLGKGMAATTNARPW